MKIKYFGQSLIIDLSEINSPAKQTYLAYISCPASEVRTCKLHCRVRETPRLASCIAVYARRQDLQVALPCTRVSLGEFNQWKQSHKTH